MSEYVKVFKEKNSKSMYLHVNDNRLLQTYKTTCTNIEGLIKIELNAYQFMVIHIWKL